MPKTKNKTKGRVVFMEDSTNNGQITTRSIDKLKNGRFTPYPVRSKTIAPALAQKDSDLEHLESTEGIWDDQGIGPEDGKSDQAYGGSGDPGYNVGTLQIF